MSHPASSQSDQDVRMDSSPKQPAASSAGASNGTHPATAAPSSSSSAAASSSSSTTAAPAKSILKKNTSKKRRSLIWDESNLDNNEIERIERGPRMKIDEPKTPYQMSHGLKSPQQLDDEAMNAQAGSLPPDLTLISAQALRRREAESTSWESDDEDENAMKDDSHPTSRLTPDPHTAAAAAASTSTAPSTDPHAPSAAHHHASFAHHPQIDTHFGHPAAATSTATAATSSNSPSPSASPSASDLLVDGETRLGDLTGVDVATTKKGSLTPEQKHRQFEQKRHSNYAKMGALLSSSRALQDDDDEEKE